MFKNKIFSILIVSTIIISVIIYFTTLDSNAPTEDEINNIKNITTQKDLKPATISGPEDIIAIDKKVSTISPAENPTSPTSIKTKTEFEEYMDNSIEIKGKEYGFFIDENELYHYYKIGVDYGYITYDGNVYTIVIYKPNAEFLNVYKQMLDWVFESSGDTVYHAAETPRDQELIMEGRKIIIKDNGTKGSEIKIWNN